MASIRKRHGSFQVQIRMRGRTVSKSLPTLDSARSWARQTEHEVEAGNLPTARYQPSNLGEILTRYLEQETPKRADAYSEAVVVQTMLRDPIARHAMPMLSAQAFAAYRDRRLKTIKPSTLHRQMGILKAACRVAQDEWGWITPLDALKQIKMPAVRAPVIRRISRHVEAKLLDAAAAGRNAFLPQVIILALETGMRRSEIVKMEAEDINLGRRYILLPHTKNGHTRRVPITNRLMSSCFDGQDLKDHPLFSVTADGIKSSFKRARVRAGLPSVRFHDLRHEAISRLFERGLSVPEVASISGHRDYAVLQRYAHADFERIQRILNVGM